MSKLIAIMAADEKVRRALQALVKSAGLPAVSFVSAEEFLQSGRQQQAVCLIADIRTSGISGLEVHATLNAERSGIPVVFITAHGDEQMWAGESWPGSTNAN